MELVIEPRCENTKLTKSQPINMDCLPQSALIITDFELKPVDLYTCLKISRSFLHNRVAFATDSAK